jgi:hypothetical protein
LPQAVTGKETVDGRGDAAGCLILLVVLPILSLFAPSPLDLRLRRGASNGKAKYLSNLLDILVLGPMVVANVNCAAAGVLVDF